MADGPLPNLFLVGAPKCGTTSLYEYLRAHPRVFFPYSEQDYWRAKEPNHLCPELEIEERFSIKDRARYLGLYRDSGSAMWRGDGSPYYLGSRTAPEHIRQLARDPRIIVMLRPPAEQMRSYHRDLLRIRLEDIEDFYTAARIRQDSRGRLTVQRPGRTPPYRDYWAIGSFADQVQRYFRIFGRQAVKVVLLEDLAAKPQATFADILLFLGLDTSFRPPFAVHNETPTHARLERFMTCIYRWPGITRAAGTLFPRPFRRRVLTQLRRLESGRRERDPLGLTLQALCAHDVRRLATLIDRDLEHWLPASTRS